MEKRLWRMVVSISTQRFLAVAGPLFANPSFNRTCAKSRAVRLIQTLGINPNLITYTNKEFKMARDKARDEMVTDLGYHS